MPKTQDPRVVEATVLKLEAEAEAARADARVKNADAAKQELGLAEAKRIHRLSELKLVAAEEAEVARLAGDDHHRTYRFHTQVGSTQVNNAVATLVRWNRIDPGCNITLYIDSPGGGIIEGFHLYDTLLWLRSQGHHITTITLGMAASMGGILLQAGDVRVAGPNASLLIHEASFGAGGSMGEVEDTVEFVKKLQDRLVRILAERSTLSVTQIKNRWKRKNWWLDADEALKFGFVDAIA